MRQKNDQEPTNRKDPQNQDLTDLECPWVNPGVSDKERSKDTAILEKKCDIFPRTYQNNETPRQQHWNNATETTKNQEWGESGYKGADSDLTSDSGLNEDPNMMQSNKRADHEHPRDDDVVTL